MIVVTDIIIVDIVDIIITIIINIRIIITIAVIVINITAMVVIVAIAIVFIIAILAGDGWRELRRSRDSDRVFRDRRRVSLMRGFATLAR